MPKAHINYALAGVLINQGQTLAEIAPQVGAKNANTLCVGLRRKGVSVKLARSLEPRENVTKTLTLRLANQASEVLRERYANILSKVADATENIPVVANTKSIKELGEATEPWVRMAKIVHNWGDNELKGLVMSGLLEDQTPQEPIEIGGTPQPVVDGTDQTVNNLSDNSTSDTQTSNAS